MMNHGMDRADILIVDDRLDGLITLEAVLANMNVNVIKAQSGQEALSLITRYDFAVILLDVQMPGMDGIETASKIREMETHKHIPIIFVTAINKDDSYVTKGYNEGAVDYILKPFNPLILRSKVKVFIELFLQGRRLRYQEALLLQAERSERVRQLAELELEALRRYRNFADAIPHIVCRTRPDSTPEYFNKVWTDYTGISIEASMAEGLQIATHHDDRQPLMRTWLDALITGKPFETEIRLKRKDGFYRWHLVRAIPERGPDNEILAWIGTATDIDDRKRSAQELVRAKNDAESASIAKTQFLANMSHEIRTPLAAILGFADLLANTTQPEEDRTNCVKTIQRNGEQLLHLVNEILDISKVEAGKLEIEKIKVNLHEFLSDLRLLFDLKANEKGLDFQVHVENGVPLFVETDPVRLRQILLNVVGNALKFTDRGSVRLRVSFDSSAHGLNFEVLDTGVGIESENATKLFQPFTQADSSTARKYGGTGLGLALSKKLAQLLGGNIHLVSTGPLGSAFEVRILASAAEIQDGPKWIPEGVLAPRSHEPVEISQNSAPQNLSGLRILLVDDAPDNRVLISRFLKNAGALVETAINGSEGIEKALSINYDAILMDIQMPGTDGFMATEHLRSNGLTAPIIALTAHAIKSVQDRCMSGGFNDHLSKPVDKKKLVECVSQWIERRNEHLALGSQ